MATGRAQIYTLEVDYGMSFDQMVEAGRYDWRNPGITRQLYTTMGEGKKRFQAELIRLKRGGLTKTVLATARKRRLIRPAPEHLLAFGAQYPDVQEEFLVVGLYEEDKWVRDSDGNLGILCLGENERGRYIGFAWPIFAWRVGDGFLFLRNN